MVKIRASFNVAGDNFSPSLFAKMSSVKLVDAHEPGDIGSRGKYRGQPMPYGSADIEVSNKAESDWSSFGELLTMVESCIDSLRQAKAKDMGLSVSLFHDGQCNFGFSKAELQRIAALNVDMSVSCYSDDLE